MASMADHSIRIPPVVAAVPKVTFGAKLSVGASAAIVGTVMIYPLDMIKTQLQTAKNVSGASGALETVRSIAASYGVKGLYRGLGTNLTGMVPEKAVKLAVNDTLREVFQARHGGSILLHEEMAAGAVAGALQVVVTCPMEMVKIRLQTQAMLPKHLQSTAGEVLRELGLRGLYRGAAATLMRDIPFSIIFFPGYANAKKLFSSYERQDGVESETPFWAMLLSGMMAGAVAAGTVTPCDVIKTRIQAPSSAPNATVASVFRSVVRYEGVGALFKNTLTTDAQGAVARMCIFAPLFGLVTSAFELQKQWLVRHA